MKILTKTMGVIVLAMALCGAFTLAAQAYIIDFDVSPSFPGEPAQGVISYATVGGVLEGANIAVTAVTGVGTPANSGVVVPVHAILTFNTGDFDSANSNTWFFNTGGSISITGTFNGGPSEALLFNGTFTDPAVVGFGSTFKIAGGIFSDQKACSVLEYFGISGSPLFTEGGLNISFNATSGAPGINSTFTSTNVISGNVSNTPVPASVLLLGGGLLGMVGLGFRRRKR